MNGFLLSTAAFKGLSEGAQREVLASIGLTSFDHTSAYSAPKDGAGSIVPTDSGDGPVELTVAMVRKLTDKLSDKTLGALKVIARSDSQQFRMKDVIEDTNGASNYMDLRGVWSALTRRTRKVMGDDNVDLIWWIGDSIYDGGGNYVDHVGAVAPLTHLSLRTHFGL